MVTVLGVVVVRAIVVVKETVLEVVVVRALMVIMLVVVVKNLKKSGSGMIKKPTIMLKNIQRFLSHDHLQNQLEMLKVSLTLLNVSIC